MTTTQTTRPATYRKTKTGEWVAFAPLADVRPESSIVVAKRDGSTKVEWIERLGRPFMVDGTEMVYCYLAPQRTRHTGGSYERGCKSGTGDCLSFNVFGCWSCGS